MHSRNIYEEQLHRRFLWGLTVCGTYVRSCLLSNDNIYASRCVDVSGPEGREHFVELLVNWSMCESPRAGYDPTIWRNDARDKWMINVFDGGAIRTYHELWICVRTSLLFGRHTRCFIGKARGAEDNEKVLIKDYWPHIAEDAAGGQPNEITFLREIRDKLCDVPGLAGKYPVLETGGVVKVKGEDADMVDDTTTAAMSDLELAKPVLLRKHVRIAMRPIGVSLNMVDSPDELIIAVCDAMEAHTEIVRRCGILHRDISVNNILFRGIGDEGEVRGMIIDFDNAVRVDSNHMAARTDAVGTPPFMSVGNMEESQVKLTALDDWESCVYLLCWLGASGVNDRDQKCYKNNPMRRILQWRSGGKGDIAEVKRMHMGSTPYFKNIILAEFIVDGRYGGLRDLAEALHKTLFFNAKVWSLCRGSFVNDEALERLQNGKRPQEKHYDFGVDINITDPFARRAEIADKIVDDLLDTLTKARDEAIKRLYPTRRETISE
ncbi:hypothetical protein IWQ56_000610 [Coemansia nantahalensis]|nr:hypothetical protein IWQ56_000610 [Coemansia nantahalensis]